MSFNFLKSKIFLVLGSAALVLVLAFWGRELWQNYQIQREVGALQTQIDRLHTHSEELSSLITYFRTPEYKERQARTLLGLQKPGEFVVALPAAAESSGQSVTPDSPDRAGNWQKWWDYFFGHK